MTGDLGAQRIRVRVIYAGRVQGVCFRATAEQLARRHAVVGFVRNLADGTVELEVESAPRHIESLLKDLAAEYAGYISKSPRTTLAVRNDETHFEIRA
jgi:acylphosphatase